MKIVVAGLGYVGMSCAVVLAQRHQVVGLEVDPSRADMVNARRSPIVDSELEDYLAHRDLNLVATTDKAEAYTGAEVVVIATPTNYDEKLPICPCYFE